MDAKTKATLAKISASIPDHLASSVTKVEIDDSEQKLAEAAVAAPFIDGEKKAVLRQKIESGAFLRKEEVPDEQVGAAISEHNEREVARAMEQGALPDPMTDPFYRNRMLRMQRIREGLETPNKVRPLSEEEKYEAARKFQFDRSSDPHKKKYY